MIENLMKSAVCQIKCGTQFGTGWIIGEQAVITAKHCIDAALDEGESIELFFPGIGEPKTFVAHVSAYDEELDVALLTPSKGLGSEPLQLSAVLPREGSDWVSFGFPQQKAQLGHRITGKVSQVLAQPLLRMDLDLVVDPVGALSAYAGVSGAPLLVDGKCAGLLRLKVDRTLGAISIQAMSHFLADHDIDVEDETTSKDTQGSTLPLAERTSFQTDFEMLLRQAGGQYVFLEGAHGIGKTTFCNEFSPLGSDLLILGTYNLTPRGHGAGPAFRAQPDIFYDWLLTAISTQVSGKADRKTDLKYADMVDQVTRLLAEFSRYCASRSSQGIFFIDGINEGQTADASALARLVALLPVGLPSNITIVLTAPNYHAVSNSVASYVKAKNIISLPRLSDEACLEYCRKQLKDGRNNPSLLDQICQKSQGHPLYLRYLIEYINGTQDISLQEFPTLSGSIEQYYETIWAKLLSDAEAVNLLGLLARLRWGISTDAALRMLSPAEQAVYVPTMSRIRHLLRDRNSTEIYHTSFTDFVCEKTSSLDQIVHRRIAAFCSATSDIDYCVLNLVYHLLRGDDGKAISACQQQWVDECVVLGVEPDVVLADIELTLSKAIKLAAGIEVIRLLLLQQRVGFRYNVLFTQSAYLIANALISLDRPDEAVKIAVRFNTLVVDADDALNIAYSLIAHGNEEQAFHILRLLHQSLSEAYASESGQTVDQFVTLSRLLIQIHLYAHIADGHPRVGAVAGIARRGYNALTETFGDSAPALLEAYFARIQSMSAGVLLYAHGHYGSLKRLRELAPEAAVPPAFLLTVLGGLFEYAQLASDLGHRKLPESLIDIFTDFRELLEAEDDFHDRVRPSALDTLIEFNAPADLVQLLAKKIEDFELSEILVIEKNGVDVVIIDVQQRLAEWRAKAYLEFNLAPPSFEPINARRWRKSIDQLLRAIAWCEGPARRARADEDAQRSRSAFEFMTDRILPVMHFTLAQRSKWEDCYAIPEAVFPIAWERLATLVRDCYPKELESFLQNLVSKASGQLGLYTEGFRKSLETVVRSCMPIEEGSALDDAVLDLLDVWKEHVLDGVENRHELVPELLKLIPLFAKLGAEQQAKELYKHVLSVSMGPTWYKEDQFGLLTTILRQYPTSDVLKGALSTIAGYLQRASGEMTFQRFIRYEKSHLIGELFRRNLFSHGCRYFRRQSYGTLVELTEDVQSGKIDRISPFVGMRYPGGSIDEQEAVLDIVRNSCSVDWKARWALLEIFQCGDKRHITSYAREYAKLINGASSPSVVEEMFSRLNIVIGAELSNDERSEFFKDFREALGPSYRPQADMLLQRYPRIKKPVENPDTQILVANESTPSAQSRVTQDDEMFIVPGTFGRRSSIQAAADLLRAAERQLRLKNYEACKVEAIRVLKTLQDGDWSIWRQLSSVSNDAEDLLLKAEANANVVVRCYGTLIEGEQYTAKWAVANHLIERVGGRFESAERRALLGYVLDHIRLMVGDSSHEIAMFDYLDSSEVADPREVLFSFIIELLDHPTWLRRDNAARVLLWLIESDEKYFAACARAAFQDGEGFVGEIATGAIDVLSNRSAGETWDRLNSALNLETAVANCDHISRTAVLLRIAERAAKSGRADAIPVAAQIKSSLRTGTIELASADTLPGMPQWAACILDELETIAKLGLMTQELMSNLEEELASVCAPLSIDHAYDIEGALARSFRERSKATLGRWEGKVRLALGRALNRFASQRDIYEIEAAVRVYNPNAPEGALLAGFVSPGHSIIEAINSGIGLERVIGSQDSYFLNYYESVLTEDDNTRRPVGRLIEIFAVLIPHPYARDMAFRAAMNTTCRSLDFPDAKLFKTVGPTCLRLEPEIAYFGSFTPAFPTSSFMRLAKVANADFTRISWRNGRSYEVTQCGRPESEGCLLSIPRAAVRLSDEMEMIWVVTLDGEFSCVIDQNHQKLN